MVGSWDIKIAVDAMPQKVATAFCELTGSLCGAEYTPIAYLGSQVVHGVNHAILAEQLLITGKDTKNVVIIILNEREEKFTIANIERVVESGVGLGGTVVDVKTDISEEAKTAFELALKNFVGSVVEPFALLATQVVKGTDYVFAAKVTPVVKDPKEDFAIVTVNALTKKIAFDNPLTTDVQTALGAPLGEWP